ncbi:hypothetical protein RRF57_003537 [Xylaria bambusicola]|uniref:Uncharacterized protein n=1 Tax=Xylaria bambusicola TaxID=326684 RepID=A0AAN7UGN1_9PEZI
MRFELLQITLVALIGFTTAAPVANPQDAVEKRLLPAWPYEAARRIPITGNGKRAIPPPYEELYRSTAKAE